MKVKHLLILPLSLVAFVLFFFVGMFVKTVLPTYHLITTNISIKDLSKADLIAYTYYDDGMAGISLEGKYKDEEALVTIAMDYTEFEMNEIDYPDEKEKVYIVEIYAIATVQLGNGWFDIYSEEVATIITEHY